MFEIYVVEANGTERFYNTFKDKKFAKFFVSYLNRTTKNYYFLVETE